MQSVKDIVLKNNLVSSTNNTNTAHAVRLG